MSGYRLCVTHPLGSTPEINTVLSTNYIPTAIFLEKYVDLILGLLRWAFLHAFTRESFFFKKKQHNVAFLCSCVPTGRNELALSPRLQADILDSNPTLLLTSCVLSFRTSRYCDSSPPAYKNPHTSQDLLPNLSEIRHKKVSVNSELSHALYNHAFPFHK